MQKTDGANQGKFVDLFRSWRLVRTTLVFFIQWYAHFDIYC